MNDKFSIAIKGVLSHKGEYLLRKNQRHEFELLGGKLESKDSSLEERLVEEFLEESGITIEINSFREPWLYTVGKKNIIIIPFMCKVIDIPEELFDEDGGELLWISDAQLNKINMPYGYLDSIHNRIPRKSSSPFEGKYLKFIPNYKENTFEVIINVRDSVGNLILNEALDKFIAPRECIDQHIKNKKIIAKSVIFEHSKLFINYLCL